MSFSSQEVFGILTRAVLLNLFPLLTVLNRNFWKARPCPEELRPALVPMLP